MDLASLAAVSLVSGSLLATSLVAAVPARAAPAPDSSRLEELRAAADEWDRTRVFTNRGSREFSALRVDSGGVILRAPPGRPALFVQRGLASAEPERIRWAEVERIEGARSHFLRGVTEGALVGGILGGSAALLFLLNGPHGDVGAIGYLPLGLLVGGFTGSVIANRTKWTPLYP
ncbi:MAG: hypothetical protein ABIS67_01145 [Candidatus Eisenbacteria bacterium]